MITYRSDRAVGEWVRERIPGIEGWMGDFVTMGFVLDGELLGGVVYDAYTGFDVNMHQCIEDSRVVTRGTLRAAFSFPFMQLRCQRVTGLVPSSNLAAQRFDEHLGFVLEGRKRHAFPNGDDELIYGMLKADCRFIK